MASQTALTGLSPREAVADALHRCVLGMDSNDHQLFESACLKDESMAVIAGPITLEGWTTINGFFNRVFELVTTHVISNVRVEVQDDADTATLTAHAVAHHVREEEALKLEDTSYTAYCLYTIDAVKDSGDGLWKIKKWDIKVLWTTGDRAVVHPGS